MIKLVFGKITNFIDGLEKKEFTLWQIVSIFYLTSFFRGFLEVFVNTENFGRITSPIDLFFHYPLWFIGVFLCAILILSFFTKEKVNKIGSMVAVFSFIVLVPVLTDLLLGNSGSVKYVFIWGNLSEIAKSFFSFFGSSGGSFPGATAGLRMEGVLIVLSVIFYVFYKTRNILKSFLAIGLLYCAVFLFGVMPVVLHFGYNVFTGNNSEINSETTQKFFLIDEPVLSATIERTFLADTKENESPFPSNTRGTASFILSSFFLLLDIILGAIVFYSYDKKKFGAVFKNARFLRIIYYYLFVLLGLFWGQAFAGRFFVNSLFDVFSVVLVLISGTFAGLFSVWENDEVDLEIDKISNSESVTRPLANGTFSLKEWVSQKYLFLFISLSSALLCGFYQFVFILLFISIYHIYSAYPLRLKKYLGISSFLIAVNAVVAVWMGFFIASGTENFSDFPAKYSLGVLAIVFLIENIKNIKDVKGDRQNGIKTLPVVLGEKNGKLVIGSMAFLATLLVPILFFMNTYTFFTAVVFGIIFFVLINREKFEEKHIFVSYFIFAIIIACEELLRIYEVIKI